MLWFLGLEIQRCCLHQIHSAQTRSTVLVGDLLVTSGARQKEDVDVLAGFGRGLISSTSSPNLVGGIQSHFPFGSSAVCFGGTEEWELEDPYPHWNADTRERWHSSGERNSLISLLCEYPEMRARKRRRDGIKMYEIRATLIIEQIPAPRQSRIFAWHKRGQIIRNPSVHKADHQRERRRS